MVVRIAGASSGDSRRSAMSIERWLKSRRLGELTPAGRDDPVAEQHREEEGDVGDGEDVTLGLNKNQLVQPVLNEGAGVTSLAAGQQAQFIFPDGQRTDDPEQRLDRKSVV